MLLRALLEAAQAELREVLIDVRIANMCLSERFGVQATTVERSFRGRIGAMLALGSRAQRTDILLCFNSLPPLRKCRAYVVNYVHAPHFVGAHEGIRYAPMTALRLLIERLWFKLGVRYCDEVWVQTDTMAASILQAHPCCRVKVVPLVDEVLFAALNAKDPSGVRVDSSSFSFFYPADGVGHKNHSRLLSAWKILANLGFTPRLLLTLKSNEMRSAAAMAGVPLEELSMIENLGPISREAVLERLRTCSALIFPSRAETFGLPLLEARVLGTPILASERDFVREVCAPKETFDPESPMSIALAVQRFITGNALKATEYYSAPQFLERLFSVA